MDPVVQGAIITVAGTLALAVIGGFVKIVWSSVNDRKFFVQLKDKIGNTEGSSLSKQHEVIKEAIVDRTKNIEKIEQAVHVIKETQDKEFNKVDSIDKEMIANKERYSSLNADQKEIRDNVGKLIFSWENVIAENKELKAHITELEKKNREMEEKYKKVLFRNRKNRGMEQEIER